MLSPYVMSCAACAAARKNATLKKPLVVMLVAKYTREEARQDPEGARNPVAYAVRVVEDWGDRWCGPTLLNSGQMWTWTKKNWRVVGRKAFLRAHARADGKWLPWPTSVRLPARSACLV